MDPGSTHRYTHTHQDLIPLKHTPDLERFTWSVDSMTRLTAAAWMIENKSSQTGPEVLEKLQQKAEVTEVWACFGHALYVTVIVLHVC